MMKIIKVILTVTVLSGFQWNLYAQDSKVTGLLQGYWNGAFIKGNSYQQINLSIFNRDGNLISLQIMDEWHPSFGEFEIPVEVDSLGNIALNTGYGRAKLNIDTNNLEIIGHIENTDPIIYLHLKKSPPPPDNLYEVESVNFGNGDVTLHGHLHQPNLNASKTAIIIIGGRGCYAGNTKHDLYAKFFRQYGLSVLVYNKRGTGKSNGDCSIATITDLAMDLKAAKEFLASHKSGFTKIGVLGSSAGGWVMTRAQEEELFDFMISVVGPSTSVKEQQLQSMAYGADTYGLSEKAKEQVEEYTNMMFDAPPNTKSETKFEKLLSEAENEGWLELLDDTDRPDVTDGIDNLWVRRHSYNPQKPLSTFDKPLLAIYGERDWIVPPKENIERLKELFNGERSNLLNIVIAYDAEHGMEMQQRYIELENGKSYWHFYRISPQVRIEILRFLEKYNLISKD